MERIDRPIDPAVRRRRRIRSLIVPAAVIAWLATAPEADALRGGRHVDAQRLCEEHQLVPGFRRAEGL